MTAPTFGSLFSGIGGMDLGLERAGWRSAWQVEIDKYRTKVLERHWPDVPRFTDVRAVGDAELGRVDLIAGGFPCQDISVAGARAGLDGERSGLWFEFIRVVEEIRPAWVLIENVPGLLSSPKGDPGRDFEIIVEGLAERGYGVAWRVLDSQYFGVPQRRRRVYIVGHLGAPCPPEVLLEPESCERNPTESGESKTDIAPSLRRRADSSSRDGHDIVYAVTHGGGRGYRNSAEDNFVTRPLKAGGNDRRDESHESYVVNARQDPSSAKDSPSPSTPAIPSMPSQEQSPEPRPTTETPGLSQRITSSAQARREQTELESSKTEPAERPSPSGNAPGPTPATQETNPGQRPTKQTLVTVDQRPATIVGAPADSARVREAPGVPGRVDPPHEPDGPRYAAIGDAQTVTVATWIGSRILAVMGGMTPRPKAPVMSPWMCCNCRRTVFREWPSRWTLPRLADPYYKKYGIL